MASPLRGWHAWGAVLARGSNMIPLDQLEGRTTDRVYAATVASAAAAGMNLLRVWGGGLYYPDEFYDACDRHGVMVYHVTPPRA